MQQRNPSLPPLLDCLSQCLHLHGVHTRNSPDALLIEFHRLPGLSGSGRLRSQFFQLLPHQGREIIQQL